MKKYIPVSYIPLFKQQKESQPYDICMDVICFPYLNAYLLCVTSSRQRIAILHFPLLYGPCYIPQLYYPILETT